MRYSAPGAGSPTRSVAADHEARRRSALRLVGGEPGRAAGHGVRRALRRRRFAGLLRFMLFLALVFLAAWAGVRVAHAGTEARVEGERYEVVAGDTLWRIAVAHYNDEVDPRRAVHEIRVANDYSPERVLQPGDVLVLPTAGKWSAAEFGDL